MAKKEALCTNLDKIKEDIKTGIFSPVYLLYGKEAYLKNIYKDKLKEAILAGGDEMNFTAFYGKKTEVPAVREMADTLPFFADRRLILIENSGWAKNSSTIMDYLPSMPETTHIIFVENEASAVTKLYKYIDKHGTVAKMDGMEANDLLLWLAGFGKKNGKKMRQSTMRFFLEHVDNDMLHLKNEMEKLFAYTAEREEITVEDIQAVCTMQITEQIFEMTDAVGEGNKKKALQLYRDLLFLKESPRFILNRLSRHFNILLQVKEQEKRGIPWNEMATRIGVHPFFIKKYSKQAAKFSSAQLLSALESCADSEKAFKTGKIGEQLAVELLLVELS